MDTMDIIVMKGCGLDVHQATVVACIQRQGFDKIIRTFGTTTEELLDLKQLLKEQQITHVAMESTGVYWKPVYNILEDGAWEIVLANARHMKNVPGRKTDVQDCEWICKLLRTGFLKASFIPQEDIRLMRSYTRCQKNFQYNIQNEKNRVHKLLQECNIKLTQVLSDIFGLAGTRILNDLAAGITEPVELAKHMEADKRLLPKKQQAISCLNGRTTPHHQMMLRSMLGTICYYQKQIDTMNAEVSKLLGPYKQEYELLQSIPGVKEKAAGHIIAELSANMYVFPDEQHLSSWAGLSPGSNESAGKKRSSRMRNGNTHLRAILTECAWAATKTKDTYLRAKFYKLASRMGKKKALAAIAHKILISCYHILKYKIPFKELGGDYFTKGKEDTLLLHYQKKLQKLGYRVVLQPIEA